MSLQSPRDYSREYAREHTGIQYATLTRQLYCWSTTMQTLFADAIFQRKRIPSRNGTRRARASRARWTALWPDPARRDVPGHGLKCCASCDAEVRPR